MTTAQCVGVDVFAGKVVDRHRRISGIGRVQIFNPRGWWLYRVSWWFGQMVGMGAAHLVLVCLVTAVAVMIIMFVFVSLVLVVNMAWVVFVSVGLVVAMAWVVFVTLALVVATVVTWAVAAFLMAALFIVIFRLMGSTGHGNTLLVHLERVRNYGARW